MATISIGGVVRGQGLQGMMAEVHSVTIEYSDGTEDSQNLTSDDCHVSYQLSVDEPYLSISDTITFPVDSGKTVMKTKWTFDNTNSPASTGDESTQVIEEVNGDTGEEFSDGGEFKITDWKLKINE